MKHPHNLVQQLKYCIFLISVALQSCSSLLKNTIPPIEDEQITVTAQVNGPLEEVPTSLERNSAIVPYSGLNLNIPCNSINEGSDIKSLSINLPRILPVEQVDQSSQVTELSSNNLNNSVIKVQSHDYTSTHIFTQQNIAKKQSHSRSALQQGGSMLALPGYKLFDCLHEGNFSNIYRGVCLSDGRPVVVKACTCKPLSEKKIQCFRREFELCQQVNSPHVVRYLELKQDPGYGIALIMEDDQAVELISIIPPLGLSNWEFLEIAIQIVGGLQAIHAVNIIHNDLKLSNILVHPTTKFIKIIDFNRASTLRQERQSTIPMVGTLAYISPEQTGRVNRSVDYRTDFYSLGVIFYRLLCGELPFTAQDALGVIYQHLAKQPLLPHQRKPSIALSLSQLIMKLLEKEAENRYQSCKGILHDLKLCLSALEVIGTIPDFELGQQDLSNKLTFSQYLYGRENEMKVLLDACERISLGQCEVLMVVGQPGVGKTVLIQEVQKPIALKLGYVITGKFDQLNKSVAYGALTQAFNSLIQQWLSEGEASINQWKTQLLVALGSQVRLLIKLIPALSLLVGEQSEMILADINQAKNVFNWVFQEFIKICATATHPLVVFLDDLQWADQASLDLISYLLQQPTIKYFLWIGAYRDTEVTSSHPALQVIDGLQEAGIYIQTLTLAAIQLEDSCRWLADSFHMPVLEVLPLAEVVQQKTAGNPFFLRSFLLSLYDEQLLTFSPQYRWQWDLSKIRQHLATENVIALMTYQIQQLPSESQKALSMASCLGYRLELSTLQVVMDNSAEVVLGALQPALNIGILVQDDNQLYFAHDRVQEAAYCLISETEITHMHLTIGQRLLARNTNKDVFLLDIVAQFNHCDLLITDLEQRLEIVRLNLKAAQQIKQTTAYISALNYFYTCKDWIDTKALWEIDYPLAFAFHKELAEVEYLSGHMDTSQAILTDIQPYLRSTLDKVDVFYLLIVQKNVQGHFKEAIALGQQALQLLDSGLPLDNLTEFIEETAAELKRKLHDIPLSSLLNAPLVVDSEKQALFKILGSIQSTCYQSEIELCIAVTFMLTNLGLTYGHAPECCLSYVMYGLFLCMRFEEYTLAREFGNLGLQLAEKLQSPAQYCQTRIVMLSLIAPWSRSIQELPDLFTSACEESLACGDLEYTGYGTLNKAEMIFYKGLRLSKVQQDILPLLHFVQTTKHQISIKTIQSIQRMLANLMTDTSDEWSFVTNNVHDAQFVEECCKEANSLFALCHYYILKGQAFYLYGHFEQASEELKLARQYLIFIAGQYATSIFNWYDSLTRLACYPTASVKERCTYLEQVVKNQKQMQKWQASCPENFAHKYVLIEAELARLKGEYDQAEADYDQAIELAEQHGFIQEQALAAELAAKYWLARNKTLCAQSYLNIAFNGYKQWGAKRKLIQFKVQYADLLSNLAPASLSQLVIDQKTTLSGSILKSLDLSSILKASHAISKEIELPKLLYKMMQIIIENAGAQQGTLLFVEADGTIRVQAEYTKDGTITTLQNILIDDWRNGAQTVIQYVKRLHQSIVVENATTHELFKTDPYIIQTQAKSILCVPLLKHTELRAILYVENNLISHAFIVEHVQTVLILAAQVAISLENARYFADQIGLTRKLAEQSARAQVAEESLHALTHDLQLALKASKAGTWNWQIGTNHVTWDAANYALFGLTPSESTGTYEAFLSCIHPDDRELVDQSVKRSIQEDIPYDMEYRIIWPDNSQHIIATQGHVYRNKSGQPVKMAGVCLDVTQRKQLEQERLEALQKAEEERIRSKEALYYQQRQKEYTETVCHELRNPLQGLIGTTELLKSDMDVLDANLIAYQQMPMLEAKMQLDTYMGNCKEYVVNLEECIDHLKDLLDDVLNLAKLEANKMELSIGIIQPKAIVQSVAKIFAARVSQKKLQLNLKLPEEEDLQVKGDVQRLKQVIINLLANALKFTEQGSVTLGLEVLQVAPTYVQLQFTVEDTGIGMTSEEMSRLFHRFSQANTNVAGQYGGTGLGLEISDKLVKLMNGQIKVASEKGKGTKFQFVIDCEIASQEESSVLVKQSESPIVPAILPIVELEARRILLVDDNVINQKVLAKLLQTLGYTSLQIASNGKEAVEYFMEAGPFDLIFMDIEMPIMNGFEASQQIREQEQALQLTPTPIIGLTAHTELEYKEKALAAGINVLLTKPYTKEAIQHQIATWLKEISPFKKDI